MTIGVAILLGFLAGLAIPGLWVYGKAIFKTLWQMYKKYGLKGMFTNEDINKDL